MTTVPCSRASASTSSDGGIPLETTIAEASISMISRWALSRLPTTTMSPAAMPLGVSPTCIECTHTRPASSASGSPTTSSPSSTSTIAWTFVGASTRLDVSRDSRMYRRASARSVMTPTSLPSSSTIGTRSRFSRAPIRPTSRTGSCWSATGNFSRITSRTRRKMWGRNSGSGAPLRSSSQRVCAFTSPSRTGRYSLAGSRRWRSSA